MRLRPAGLADLHALDTLERTAFSEPWSRAQIENHLAHPLGLTLVADASLQTDDHENAPALGYAALLLVAGEAELLRIATSPAVRRQGVARALLLESLEQLRARHAALCHLEVREDNGPAIALYESAGFVHVGRRSTYYRDGTAALLYLKDLQNNRDR